MLPRLFIWGLPEIPINKQTNSASRLGAIRHPDSGCTFTGDSERAEALSQFFASVSSDDRGDDFDSSFRSQVQRDLHSWSAHYDLSSKLTDALNADIGEWEVIQCLPKLPR